MLKKVVVHNFHTFNFVTTSGQETLQIYRHKICPRLNHVIRPFPWESVQEEIMSTMLLVTFELGTFIYGDDFMLPIGDPPIMFHGGSAC